MPIPTLALSPDSPGTLDADVLVLAVRGAEKPDASRERSAELVLPDGADAAALDLDGLDLAALGVGGSAGDLVRLPAGQGVAARSIALIGLGAGGDADALRAAAGVAARRLAGVGHVALALPAADPAGVAAVLEGAALGAYAFVEYRTATLAAQKAPVERITVAGVADDAGLERARGLAESVELVKDLVNTPPNDLFPASLAERAVAAAEAAGLEVRVWDEDALAADGFGGILGVGAGSTRPPRLVRVAWRPDGAEQ